MGRKKQDEPKADPHGRVTVINVKGPLEDRQHLEGISKRTMIPASSIVRAALNLWFAQNGHPPLPSTAGDD